MKVKEIKAYVREDTQSNEHVVYIPSGHDGEWLCVYQKSDGKKRVSDVTVDVDCDLEISRKKIAE